MPWSFWPRIFRWIGKSVPVESGLDLSFVTQERLRGLLEDYWAQAIRANEARAHLGTVVACGALLEGLLTFALLPKRQAAIQHSRAHKDKQGGVLELEQWNMNNLIDVAIDLEVVGKVAKDAAWAVKDFRNFVHPYLVLKGSARADASLAAGALAGTQEIVRSVRGRTAR